MLATRIALTAPATGLDLILEYLYKAGVIKAVLENPNGYVEREKYVDVLMNTVQKYSKDKYYGSPEKSSERI